MSQLTVLKSLLDDPPESDTVLQFYIDCAGDLICDIRNSNAVERKYEGIQVKMAVEMYNKRGAEGQISHTENGLSRSYEKADISDSLLRQVTPIVKTPNSTVRIVNV